MDIKRTKQYYKQLSSHDLCDCAYCQNYIGEIKSTYPKVAEYLFSLGIDIEKPFETMPLEPDETGYLLQRRSVETLPLYSSFNL